MRREVVGIIVIIVGVLVSVFTLGKGFLGKERTPSVENLREASFYKQLEGGSVQCALCPNNCVLGEGQRGLCKVRENIGGKLYSLVYGKPVTINVDPIEKKPFFHFLPGAKAYSLATAGCNLSCKYCQNWDISQRNPEDLNFVPMKPDEVVNEAIKSGANVIAFTYNEPVVWYEYMIDIAKIAKKKGLKTVMVSSGYINKEPLKELLKYLDGVKIDFKSFNSEVYEELIRGKIEPVMESIKLIYQSGKWLEIVNLVVPGYTDNLEEIKKMCQWLKESTSESVPVHFLRFWPKYKLLNLAPTAEETLKKARKVCIEAGMKYVYTGNIEDPEGSVTYCPDNGELVIKRQGFFVKENLVDKEGKAPNCKTSIPGVWK